MKRKEEIPLLQDWWSFSSYSSQNGGRTKKCLSKKEKWDTEPSVVLSSYDVAMGVDPGLYYLIVAKNEKI